MDDHPESSGAEKLLVRCRGRLEDGQRCDAVLWEILPDGGLELRFRIRQGEYSRIRLARQAVTSVSVWCPRCETRWLPASPLHPLLGGASGGVIKPVKAAA